MLKAHLLVIDPQNDFADILAGPLDPVGLTLPDGTRFRSALPVPGTLEDMERVARLVKRAGRRLDGIHITLDSHRVIDVAHPEFWRDRNGRKPPPFTLISQDNIQDGNWTPRNAQHRQRMLDYTGALQSAGKFMLMIWPEHCLIGSWGHNVIESLKSELDAWERSQNMDVNYVTKGTNAFTEHYGALMAEVPDPTDPSTQLNGELLSVLQGADIIGVAGEASSHCVMTTVEQIVRACDPLARVDRQRPHDSDDYCAILFIIPLGAGGGDVSPACSRRGPENDLGSDRPELQPLIAVNDLGDDPELGSELIDEGLADVRPVGPLGEK